MIEVTVKRSEWLRGNNNAMKARLSAITHRALGQGEEIVRTSLCESYADDAGHTIVTGRCCLGFWANAIGFRDETIMHQGTPQDLAELQCPTPTEDRPTRARDEELLGSLSNWNDVPIRTWKDFGECYVNGEATPNGNFSRLMRLNDDPSLDEDEREARIIEAGKLEDIEFTFVD